MPMEDTYGIQSRIGSIIVVERWYCCRGSPVFSDRNIQDGDHPSDDTPGCGIHSCGKSWTDRALFFKGAPIALTLDRDPDKQIKHMMVTLP